ncbi:MAG: hypothetical protein IPP90_21320 [Gemmatimonadaceae bacterium]|nr:hypothetical protein [Gemmatimonadaceae bacterium]
MNATRLLTSGVAAVVGTALLAYLSAAPVPYHAPESARLRLSWSARPERIEVCHTLSDEELARLAEHMRQRVSCEGVFATYTLRIGVDGRVIGESVVRGAGMRNDRPLYLLRDYTVPPGTHRFQVSLTRREKTDDDAAAFAKAVVPEVDTGLYAGRAQREATEHSRRARAAIPASLTLDTVFSLTPQHVALVTFNAERRTLELHAESPRR